MEPDKHYFIEGLFIIGFSIATALFTLWLVTSGHRDDVLYRIHFAESVSGLAIGDAVKFHGVDVGTVKAMSLDAADQRRVQVDVRLRKESPVKTDTKATLSMKGLTGVNFIELSGGAADAKDLVAVTPAGQIPEIPAEKSKLAVILAWDEGTGSGTNVSSHVPAVVLSAYTTPGTTSATAYDHNALLRTTEEIAGVSLLGDAASASSMRSAFGF